MFFKKDKKKVEENFLTKVGALLIHTAKIDENYTAKEEEIIEKTADNFCSMLQDIKKGSKTEINEINGIFYEMGKKQNINAKLNLEYLKKIKTLVDT